MKLERTLEMNKEDKEDFETKSKVKILLTGLIGFEKIEITGNALYKGKYCYLLHATTDKKNHDMLPAYKLLDCKERNIQQGPG